MRFAPLAVALLLAAFPFASQAQDTGVSSDEQILLKEVMNNKRKVYADNLNLTETESYAFWPIYDEYEAKVKKLNDRFLALVNDYATKFDTMTDADAKAMLKEKMKIEKDRMDLKQDYTKKVEKVLPGKKALRYSQIETRLDILLRKDVYGIIPMAPVK